LFQLYLADPKLLVQALAGFALDLCFVTDFGLQRNQVALVLFLQQQ
jgi:hypothetical protein